MRSITAAAAALAVLSFASVAWPCRARPVPVVAEPAQAGGEAQRLLRAAREAEASATREESAARSADARALSFQRSADGALARAAQVRGSERARLLSQALSFEDAAIAARADADRGFVRAADLRQRASDLRDRADARFGGTTVDPWRRRVVAHRAEL